MSRRLAVSLLLLTAFPALAACGGSESAEDSPELVKPGSLTFARIYDPATGPVGFQTELLEDIAGRLDLDASFAPAAPGIQSRILADRRADAVAPTPIRERTSATIAYTAPYFEDLDTGTLYGIGVLAGPDPEEDTELLEDLDEALSEIKDDGTLQKLYDEWLDGEKVPDAVLNDETR